MPKIITVASNKGGTGKTTLTLLISQYLARQGNRVLVIDLDPQTNISRRYVDMVIDKQKASEWSPPDHPDYNSEEDELWERNPSSAHIWHCGGTIAYDTNHENVWLYAGDSHLLQEVEMLKTESVHREVVEYFQKFITLPDVQEEYDYIVIDTRPSKGPLVQAALFASDHVLIPSEMEAPSIEGIYGLLAFVKKTNEIRSPDNQLNLLGILPNKIRNFKIHKDTLDAFNSSASLSSIMFQNTLPDLVAFKESMSFGGTSVFDLPDSTKAKKAAVSMMEEFMEKLQQKEV